MAPERRPRSEWGLRLGDVRVPRLWPVAILVVALLLRRRERREVEVAEKVGRDLGEITTTRWQSVDSMQQDLRRLTWALLIVAVATLVVALGALFR